MIVFKVMYYFMGLVFIFVELAKLSQISKYTKKITDYRAWNKSKKAKEDKSELWDKMPEEFKTFMGYMTAYMFAELIWLGFGLFTFNWLFILAYFLISIITSKVIPTRKLPYSSGLVAYTGFWSILTISFYIFLIINTFHLHITMHQALQWIGF
jgi:hypothetical protein